MFKKRGRFLAAKFGPVVEKQEGVAPKSGLRFRETWHRVFVFARSQAEALWTWSNFLHRQCAGSVSPLCINMDETNVSLSLQPGKGHLSLEARKRKRSALPLARNVSLGDRRATMTHALTICNDAEVQPLIPQLLFLKESLVSQQLYLDIKSSLPPTFVCLRQTKAWMNTDSMLQYITSLRRALAGELLRRKVILYLDMFKSHYNQRVLAAAARSQIHLCFLPAKLTWALQPADIHVFAGYKRRLAQELEGKAICTVDGKVGWRTLTQCITVTDREFVQTKVWAKAFKDNGLVGHQQNISKRCRDKLEILPQVFPLAQGFPTLRQLQEVFPNRAIIPVHDLFRPLMRAGPPRVPLRAKRKAAPMPPVPPHSANPWHGRTRSTSQLEPSVPASSSSSSAALP